MNILDPYLYLEVDGRRAAVLPASDADRATALGIEVLDPYELGRDELVAAGMARWSIDAETALRAAQRLGVSRATVPFEFPLAVADRLRAAGIEVVVDPTAFERRRRPRTAHQIEGIRRASAAAVAAQAAAGELIRVLPGDLTCEAVRARMQEVCDELGCDLPDDVVVGPGAQGATGHDPGSGPIERGQPVIVDVWPQDRASRCWSDMTRTYIAGDEPPAEDIARWLALSREALELVLADIRPGASCRALYERSTEPFVAAGEPTQLTKPEGETLRDGYWWSLGHGVGLEVHEAPILGRFDDELVEGDVVAVEPGCVRLGYGGARLEDLVLVTAGGFENLTPLSYDL